MQIVTRYRSAVLPLLLAAVVTACGAASAAPASVTCHTQYRPDAETLTGAREPSVTVERADDLAQHPETVEFETLTLQVTFHGDAPEGRNVSVVVSTPDGQPLVRDLYQFTDGRELRREFAGGHGFTGLQYVFHEGASLQVWCQADA